jgi:hypothetical protein
MTRGLYNELNDTIPREIYPVIEQLKLTLPTLYHADETAWLETMARLVAEGRWEELDRDHLSEYLQDMARRDRREVLSRLTVLLAHLLKWEHQPERRSGSWQATIRSQRHELGDLLESGTLRNHAVDVLDRAYRRAVEQASLDTGKAETEFPQSCPYTLEQILAGA